MAVPRKLVVVPNAATRELWRIAESGAISELETVLPRADINACNEHGMTALMRAAYHGRVEMVRVLLEHGADPNLTRNDNFTALSLAAFFGHAEIVKTLMRHGANADVATRFGTSASVWAKARSFGDVARCLEKRNERNLEQRKERKEAPLAAPARPAAPAPQLVVRKLKEPPEIWDLVHEAPRNFDPRSAFMARIGSMKGGLLTVGALLVVVGVAVGAVMFFTNRTPSLSTAPAVTTTTTVPAPVDHQSPAPVNAVTEAPPPSAAPETVSAEINTTVTRRARPSARSPAFSPEVIKPPNVGNSVGTEETVAAPPPAAPKVVSREPEAKNTAVPVSHQVISPPKGSKPKGKVIQWP